MATPEPTDAVTAEKPAVAPAVTDPTSPAEPLARASLPGETAAAAAVRDGRRQPEATLLVDTEPDIMTLHTREAYWMFRGRGWAQDRRRILGGQRAAAALNELRHISVGGNPYADWFLVQFEERLDQVRADLAALAQEQHRCIESLRAKGLALHILGSREPLQLAVAFGSAYGYAIAEAVVEFDAFVRIVKTLVLKNRITAQAGRALLRSAGRPLRRLFVQVILWERALRTKPWRDIRRRDYLDFSDEASGRRVAAAIARFGPLPDRILSGAILPRHYPRRTGGAGDDVLTVRAAGGAERPGAPDASLV